MQRIVILGNAGSGKSTLARRLGARLGLPIVHLDRLFWEPGWTEPTTEAFRARLSPFLAGGRWITEGNYISRTFDMRLPLADMVIMMETPRWLCVWRVFWRTVLARPRPDLPDGCSEGVKGDLPQFLRDTWNFQERRARMEAAIPKMAPAATVVRLRTSGEAARFLRGLAP